MAEGNRRYSLAVLARMNNLAVPYIVIREEKFCAGWLEIPDPLAMFTIDQAAAVHNSGGYHELKATLLESAHTGQPFNHPLNGRVMPRWKRYAQ